MNGGGNNNKSNGWVYPDGQQPTQSNSRPQNRPVTQNRAQNNSRTQNNSRAQNNSRPQNNTRPQNGQYQQPRSQSGVNGQNQQYRGYAQNGQRQSQTQPNRNLRADGYQNSYNQNGRPHRQQPQRQIPQQRQNTPQRKPPRESVLPKILSWLTMFALTFVIMAGAVGAIFFVSLNKTVPTVADKLYYTFGEGKTAVKSSSSSSVAAKNGVVCVNFTALADFLSMAVTGDSGYMRYTVGDGSDNAALDEWVGFTVGSGVAYVNGQAVRLTDPTYLVGDDLWVPLEFVKTYISGLSVAMEDEKVAVTHAADDYGTQLPVAFTLKRTASSSPVSEERFADPAVEFSADLSAYEEYMNPEDKDAYLTLINVDNPLSESYVPDDLADVVDTRKDGRATQKLRLCAEKALEAFFMEMRANNINLVSVTSGYRSYAYQTQLFDQRLAMYPTLSSTEAYAEAAKVVAIPGTSEHQSGLCVDMHNLNSADVAFAETGAYAWMKENAHKFGFIIRFPADKVDITGISFEPWHYRFVGRYHATRIYETGLSLEEYCAAYYKQ